MVRLLIRLAMFLGSSAIGLFVAALILDGFSLAVTSFVLVVVIFAILQEALSLAIPKHVVLGAVGLASTFVALVLTDILSAGLRIRGLWTWVWATLIVWLAASLATWALARWLEPGRAPSRARR